MSDIRVPSLDVSNNLPTLARAAIAENLADGGSVEGAAVAGAVSTVGDNRYARTAVDATQRLMAILKNETRDASILAVSDSTGVTTDRWIYRLATLLGPEWPRWTVLHQFWNDTTGGYDTPTTVQTGTGSRTLNIYTAAVSGTQTFDWQGVRATAAIYALTPDVVMISMGHNEQADSKNWHARYTALSESIATGLPSADIIIIGQNPENANTYQQARNEVYREIAARRGYGFIDIQQVWLDSGNPNALNIDGIHPTSAGSALWAATVKQAFIYQPQRSPRPQSLSPLGMAGSNLLQNSQLTLSGGSPSNWLMTSATAAVDATNYESVSGDGAAGTFTSTAVKFTATAAGARIEQYVSPKRVQGKWVTFSARVFIPTGHTTGAARIGIADSTGSSIMDQGPGPTGAFRTIAQTRFVPASATSCRALLYIDTSGTSGVSGGLAAVTVDRVCMSVGKFPTGLVAAQPGPAGATGTSAGQIDFCSTFGSNPNLMLLASNSGSWGFGAGNNASYSLIIPHRNMTITKMVWLVATTGGNYDIGIFDASGNLLWSKGSTATPAAGFVTETVSSLALVSGTKYYVGFSFDNTTAKIRGVAGQGADFSKLLDGTGSTLLKSSGFPLATGAMPTAAYAQVPLIMLREA